MEDLVILFVGSIWESERTAISSVFGRVFVAMGWSDILFYVRYKGVFGHWSWKTNVVQAGGIVESQVTRVKRNIHQVMFRIEDSLRHVEVFIGRIWQNDDPMFIVCCFFFFPMTHNLKELQQKRRDLRYGNATEKRRRTASCVFPGSARCWLNVLEVFWIL